MPLYYGSGEIRNKVRLMIIVFILMKNFSHVSDSVYVTIPSYCGYNVGHRSTALLVMQFLPTTDKQADQIWHLFAYYPE